MKLLVYVTKLGERTGQQTDKSRPCNQLYDRWQGRAKNRRWTHFCLFNSRDMLNRGLVRSKHIDVHSFEESIAQPRHQMTDPTLCMRQAVVMHHFVDQRVKERAHNQHTVQTQTTESKTQYKRKADSTCMRSSGFNFQMAAAHILFARAPADCHHPVNPHTHETREQTDISSYRST